MWNLKLLWALFYIISKYNAAGGGLLNTPVKAVLNVAVDGEEDVIEKTNEVVNEVKKYVCQENDPYRAIDGFCNNLKKPELGSAGTPYARYLDNSCCDGKESLPCTEEKGCLTSARLISLKLYDNKKKLDPNWTVILMGFGQFLVHDLVFGRISNRVACCANGKYTFLQETHPKCAAIDIPKDDPMFGCIECKNFVRTDSTGCDPKDPTSGVTHYLDVSTVYGSDDLNAWSLRTGYNGKLLSVERKGKEWLPQNLNPTEACFNITCPEEPCYRAGDVRVNQNTILTLIQIIILRLHNYIAGKLCSGGKLCPYTDQQCYEETRRIVIAIIQNIVYTEYLPIILGRKDMIKNKLLFEKSCRDKDGHINDYSCECDASMSVECASAAFRGQHSAIPGKFNLYFNNDHEDKDKNSCDEDPFDVEGFIELSGYMNKPSIIEKGNNSIGLSRCLFAQHQEAVDTNFDDEIRHRLFRLGNKFGEDLCSRDIQRSRDHCVATYCEAAVKFGILSQCECFDDLKQVISDKYIKILKKVYNNNVKNVELMTGGMVENNVPGTLTGPTFQAIMIKQFRNIRCGDRYFYEEGNQPYPFTCEQLDNIRSIPMASIICNHGDGIDMIPKNAFKKISKSNPLVPCSDLPTLDCSLFSNFNPDYSASVPTV